MDNFFENDIDNTLDSTAVFRPQSMPFKYYTDKNYKDENHFDDDFVLEVGRLNELNGAK